MALVMAIGITSVLGIAGTTAIAYSTSASTQSSQSALAPERVLARRGRDQQRDVDAQPADEQRARPGHAAEVHQQRARSTRTRPPTRTSTSTWLHATVDGGTVDYCGTLIRSQALWYVTSMGKIRNPNKSTANVDEDAWRRRSPSRRA